MAGETVVEAATAVAASGSVGSVVGQIAKISGCTVVSIAGGEPKCRDVLGGLGFDFCIDHRAKDLPARRASTICGPTNPDHAPPFSDLARSMSLRIECASCKQRECPLGHHACTQGFTHRLARIAPDGGVIRSICVRDIATCLLHD